uniref:Uncharacterized protein n=1 Tax=Lactuca sativa TaxID=4236 RepID=A0A9R1WNC4_LACSA|nr:hypothetical protein LSAT_V11C100039820 [Lactuca sativa]
MPQRRCRRHRKQPGKPLMVDKRTCSLQQGRDLPRGFSRMEGGWVDVCLEYMLFSVLLLLYEPFLAGKSMKVRHHHHEVVAATVFPPLTTNSSGYVCVCILCVKWYKEFLGRNYHHHHHCKWWLLPTTTAEVAVGGVWPCGTLIGLVA